MKIVAVPLAADFRADVAAMAKASTPSTLILVGSAPNYDEGVIDPIAELGQLAIEHDLWLHTDARMGGIIAPFVRELGYPVTDFDFSVPGEPARSKRLSRARLGSR